MSFQTLLERNKLSEECELLTELLMLKHYKNLTDNRLNMSSARRRSIPQKKVVKTTDATSLNDSKLVDSGPNYFRQDDTEYIHTAFIDETYAEGLADQPL